ncbi:VRR-NUC domain-containing protein [Paenibacillus pasadenensis]|uniref:VRR-NUC domain-containing protein n=1 Tax=Paenibacillus pasadenensis TaxID=217090 RepID=UPI00203E4A39|nr:VRR-NUC domain-containing protein [Paenibacillus pasadenensis]MCM3746558.1 VRR-NUC domain-containing protein [Paenibacillus pasadenensis]
MPARKESSIQTSIIRFLRGLGAYVVNHHGGLYSAAGVPDILACVNGRAVYIEVKRDGGELSVLQEQHLLRIKKAGGLAIVARSVAEVQQALADAGLTKGDGIGEQS